MSIKDNIKEKILLVNLAKQFGEVPDPKIVAEIDRYNSIQENLKSSIRSNFSRDFGTAAKRVQIIEETKASYPKPPSLSDIVQLELVDDIVPLIETREISYPTPPSLEELTEFFTSLPVEEVIVDTVEEIVEPIVPEKIDTLVDVASKFISDKADNNVEEELDTTKLEINALTQKIKYLEQWMSRVAATSAGGGEVRVLRMDDVVSSTVGNGKYLKYDGATQKLVFDTPVTSGAEAVATISDTAPADPIAGKLWYNTTDGSMYIYLEVSGVSQWVAM